MRSFTGLGRSRASRHLGLIFSPLQNMFVFLGTFSTYLLPRVCLDGVSSVLDRRSERRRTAPKRTLRAEPRIADFSPSLRGPRQMNTGRRLAISAARWRAEGSACVCKGDELSQAAMQMNPEYSDL